MKTIALATAVVSMLLFVACGGSNTGSNPLVAQYKVSAPEGSSVTVQFGTDTNYGLATSPVTVPAGQDSVTVLVAGMRPNTKYHMRAITTMPDSSQQTDSDHTYTTGGIPPDLIPSVRVTTHSGMQASSGVELLGLNPAGGSADKRLTVLALDPSGNIIWYYNYDHSLGIAQPVKLLPNGHFLLNLYVGTAAPGGLLREIDLAGNTIHEFSVDDLNQWLSTAGYNFTAYSMHHDFVLLPNGHLLVLMNINKDFDNLVGYSGTTTVLGDAIVDLDPDYNPVWVWSTFDHLDVNRHPMQFPDWTHANALVYSPDDGNLLLSLRHQYWVVKIDYANGQGTGDILWRLGPGGDFTLLNSSSPADWFYAQHYANIVSPNSAGDFQLALFDNGDNRVLDTSGTVCGVNGAPACYSRPAIFEVNENDKTAQVLWSQQTVYSFWGGAIQELPNSNLFVDITTPADNIKGARMVELTQEQTPQVVWQLDVNGQNSYRTIHLPSLYPGVQW